MAATTRAGGKGKKGRKFGRNKKYSDRRALEGLDRKNQIRRLDRHLKRYPGDQAARSFLNKL